MSRDTAMARLLRLQAVTAALSAAHTPSQVAEAVFEHGLRAMGASAASLFRAVEPGRLQLLHEAGIGDLAQQDFASFGLDAPVPSADAYRSGEPVWLATPEQIQTRYPSCEQYRAEQGSQSWAAIPLIVGSGMIGTVSLAFSTAQRFTEDERTFICAVAAQCAQALERAILHEDLQHRANALAESEQRYRALFENSLDGILATAPDGRIFAANRAACEMFQWSEADIIRLGREGLLDPGDRVRKQDLLAERARTGRLRGELRHMRKSGETFPAEVSSIIMADGRNSFVVLRDITERKRAEEALRDSEARFRSMAEGMPQFVFELDPNGQARYFNQRWREYMGCEPRDVGDGSQLVHPEDRSAMHQRWAQAFETGTPYECEYRLRRLDGEYRWFLSRAFPVRSSEGHIVRWFGTATDIHDLKEAQEALREADRRKDEFLAMLAHELRNPLAAISNSHQVLERTPTEDPKVTRMRAIIGRQVRHLSKLVDDLLDVARVTLRKIPLRKERLSLATCVEQGITAAHPLIDELRHDLTVQLPSQPIWVDVDPVRIEQVVTNLLTNAARFTEPNGRIVVALRREGGEAVLTVTDNGIGMSPELMAHVFEPFIQADRSLERSTGGLGIGLTLVRQLTELHGGRVAVRSEGLGKGAEFEVRLPVAPRPEAPMQGATPRESGRRLRVLVVDDNADAAESLSDLIGIWGHEVDCAFDGETALQRIAERAPDLVLLDIGMPVMNGYEVARRIRELPGIRGVQLHALTGYGDEESRERVRASGFDGHLVKPVASGTLEQVIAEVVRRIGG